MTRLLASESAEFWSRALKFDLGHHARVATLCKWAGYFVRRSIRNDRSDGTALVLEGPTGTGKTTVGRLIVRAFNDWIMTAVYAGVTQWRRNPLPKAAILSWSRYCRDVERGDIGPWRVDEILEADVIVIDDVGAEADRFRSGGHKAEMRDFLEECSSKWLMISTNILRRDWPEAFGKRVASRLDSARSFDTTGIPDYRIAKGLKTLTR